MTNIVQGNSVVLSFFKNDWYTFLCADNITLTLSSEVLPIRTVSSGHWAKNTYQSLSWSANITGVLIVNQITNPNFSGLDMVDNQLNFNPIECRCTFYDDQGNIKSFQGYVMVQGVSFGISSGNVVKNDVSLTGNGELKYFDGLIPCDSTILTIVVTGQTAADGIVHITYTYTGAPYQVKYRIDGTGNYIYALVGTTLDIPSLALGSHSVEIIPVCSNGYEADFGTSQAFVVTQSLTCSATITAITVTTTTATPIFGVAAPNYKYSIDGAAWVYVTSSFVVPIGGLSVGPHSIEMVPICSNSVEGTGFTQAFTVTSNPAQSIINFSATIFPYAGQYLQIFVNGIYNSGLTATGSGTLTVATGSSVMARVYSNAPGGTRSVTLMVVDTTTSATLYNTTNSSPDLEQYTFTASGGDTYSITGTISP